ncbi:N-terminal kinase-like protein isoform X2 [Dreissena polymorpha]|uniref:N-terminal kinase-like protein isoform X2 n=1 Tax=Dreissena polymorpha TaxID=45954 RepID=UPI002264D071|nr:N-terminal kinase-like protein isoform X2 [Dreissena polymorpha]
MWSLFSRDPAKDFAYVIGEKITGLEDKSVWTLHQGKKKSSGDPVSVFAFDIKASSEIQAALARSSFKRIKTLRHPNILTFLDGIETDKVIYIATEPVTPLETYLHNNDAAQRETQLAISWGLHKVTKGLSFLVNDCGLIHNNICMSSVFVDQAGEWKLGGVDYMYPASGADSMPPVKILPYLERYDPPEKSDLHRGIKGEKWSSDMWGLGCLIWEVFNGPLPRTTALKAFGKIPKNLVPNYCELVCANPNSRPNPAKYISDCCGQGGFLNNPFVKTMLFLEEMQIKDQAEKAKFFGKLAEALDSFPKQLSRHKVLPQLLHAYEFGNCGSMVLAPLFKVGRLLEQEEYQAKIVPCVVKLFSSPDRNTRVKLLQQIDMFVEHLQAQTVNDKIFPNIVSGFLDTNPVVRESTIKAMLHLAPKLNYKNLNEELMKHFARLQAKDDQGGIRTNTTVCLGKIASYLSPQMRQRILCSAFLRSIKDPFPPARQAGIIGMGSTQHLFTMADIANRLMPPLCAMTLDPEKPVRDTAFKTLKSFMERLEKLSEDPEVLHELEKDVLSGGVPDNSAAGWAGWAIGGVSNLTSKVYSKATKKSPTAGPAMKGSAPSSEIPSVPAAPKPDTGPKVTDNNSRDDVVEDDDSSAGWDNDDDDWGDIDSPAPPVPAPTHTRPAPLASRAPGISDLDTHKSPVGGDQGWGEDDEEDWGDIDVVPTSQPVNATQSSSRNDTKSVPKSSKISDSQKTQQSDWGWGDSNMSEFEQATQMPSKPAKGALKLSGQKKTAPVDDFSWIEEEFAPIEDKTVKPASSYNWGDADAGGGGGGAADFFTTVDTGSRTAKRSSDEPKKILTPTSRETTPVQNQSNPSTAAVTSNQSTVVHTTGARHQSTVGPPSGIGEDSYWGSTGGWEDDGWGDSSASNESEADRKKREREDKRLQRQKELEDKRQAKKSSAMKLGAKKLASD